MSRMTKFTRQWHHLPSRPEVWEKKRTLRANRNLSHQEERAVLKDPEALEHSTQHSTTLQTHALFDVI